ncbi:hypothetical protein ACFVYG_08695 [Streptomyces sp. NPDC058256]|uniref:hypothetical protein n=1 Tax=Streptomyces sp. NPDC058256 TaxID=3346408 RepID=UPI0036E1A02A
MEAQQVVDLINEVSFRPGWEFDASVLADGAPYVIVKAFVETVNSDRDNALNGYPEEIVLGPEAIINADHYMGQGDLYAGMFQWLIELETHECREFFRVGKDKQAPFHPHRADGQRAWDALQRGSTVETF